MKNKIFLFALVLTSLTACGTWKDQYGNPVTQQDEFDCNQKCGVYDLRQSAIAAGYCNSQCLQAKGYRVVK